MNLSEPVESSAADSAISMFFPFQAAGTVPETDSSQHNSAADNHIPGHHYINTFQGDQNQQQTHANQQPVGCNGQTVTNFLPFFLKRSHQVRTTV